MSIPVPSGPSAPGLPRDICLTAEGSQPFIWGNIPTVQMGRLRPREGRDCTAGPWGSRGRGLGGWGAVK